MLQSIQEGGRESEEGSVKTGGVYFLYEESTEEGEQRKEVYITSGSRGLPQRCEFSCKMEIEMFQ